jgi:hypothetical protein
LKGEYLVIAFALKGLCHPGTCFFLLSGTVKYQGLILAVFVAPPVYPGGILSDGRWDFLAAPPPVALGAHVYDYRVRAAQQVFDLVSCDPVDFTTVACQGNDRLAPNQQKRDPPPGTRFQKAGLFQRQDEKVH